MITSSESLSMAESLAYLKKDEKHLELEAFIKKFSELTPKQAKEMRGKIGALKNIKVNEEQISKIIDLLPENSADLNKIFIGVSLDEDETKHILDIVKEYK